MIKNFLTSLMSRLSFDVFRPNKTKITKTITSILGVTKSGNVPLGLLYVMLSSISREISGECPWDTGEECFQGNVNYWSPKCRNILCPGYLHPWGLIAYTSRSAALSSIDDRFDFSSFRHMTTSDWVDVGTLGVEVLFDWGGAGALGGYGAFYYGGLYWGDNSQATTGVNVHIGDKWTITVSKDPITGSWVVGPPIADPTNLGSYNPVASGGTYTGNYETVYTIEIINFDGYVQNFNDAVLEMCLATSKDIWLDFWGDYFGIKRLIIIGGEETDSDYRTRIMREITRAKGTRSVLLELAKDYFKKDTVTITEYHETGAASVVELGSAYYTCISGHLSALINQPPNPAFWVAGGTAGNAWTAGVNYNQEAAFRWDGPVLTPVDPARGLWPYQFYINIPSSRSPSAKFIKTGSNLIADGKFYAWDVSTGFPVATELVDVHAIGGGSDFPFPAPPLASSFCTFGSVEKFSGIYSVLSIPGVGGAYIWEYWNGTGWTVLTVNGAAKDFSGTGYICWEIPIPSTAWVKADNKAFNIPNTGIEMFWVRCRMTVVPAVNPDADYLAIVFAGQTCRGHYIGTGVLPVPPGTYDPTKRDNNNCYVYWSSSWEKPIWITSFQDTVDRIKTAGTTAIVNPIV